MPHDFGCYKFAALLAFSHTNAAPMAVLTNKVDEDGLTIDDVRIPLRSVCSATHLMRRQDAAEKAYKLRSQVQGRSVQEYSALLKTRPRLTHSQNHSRNHRSRYAGWEHFSDYGRRFADQTTWLLMSLGGLVEEGLCEWWRGEWTEDGLWGGGRKRVWS